MADLARFSLLDYFDHFLFSGDVGKWKPNADPFLQLMDEMGVGEDGGGGKTAVYVGDDPASDVVGGRAAGMKTIYVKSTQRFHKPNGVEPDAEINQLGELIQILQKWRKP
jgi:putative hydrolase of the HAD superfamily